MKKYRSQLLWFSLLLIIGYACSNDPSLNATRLRISLTDAPLSTRAESVMISEFNVDIQKIEISATDTLSNNEAWTTLDFNGGVYNILPLTNGKSKQIADQYFPAGVLRRIKIHFGNNSTLTVIKDGTASDERLILDPAFEDGTTYEVNASLYANYISNIMIDINAALSFYERNGNYFFKPHIRVFAETYGGSLKGYVLPPEAAPFVVITNDMDTLFTWPEAQDGMFKFLGLQPGEWDIHIYPNAESGYRDSIFSDTVYSGKATELQSKITLLKISDTDDNEGDNGDDGDDIGNDNNDGNGNGDSDQDED